MSHLYYGNHDFKIAEFRDRKVIHELEMAMTVFDCIIPDDSGIYCSSAITTGRELYFEIFKPYNAQSEKELATKLGNDRYAEVKMELTQSNIQRGLAFAESLRVRGFINVITPGPFIAPGFEQEHYLYFWEWVIIKKVCEARFNEGWEFSNGCTLEYATAARKGIPRFDHLGRPLERSEAISKMETAVRELTACSITAAKLERHLMHLREMETDDR